MTQFGQNPQQHPATRTSRNIGNFFGAEMERHLKADRLPLNARFSRSLSTPMGCRILWAMDAALSARRASLPAS
jgi:hypothetical protein